MQLTTNITALARTARTSKTATKHLKLFIDDKVFHLPTFILKSLKECTLISASFFFIAIAKSAIVTM